MFITHKNNILQNVEDVEWMCRRSSKGLTNSEYWTWIGTITTQDDGGHDVVTYPSEDFTIVECLDEDVQTRLAQLGDYVSSLPEGITYNIKWSDSKVSAVTGQDMEGEDITIQTHFSGDDTAKDARLLAEEWTRIRNERTRLLAETDWMAGTDTTLNVVWKAYRKELRDLPDEQSSKTSFEDIVWPTKPS
jgi:hypothetical protein